MEWRITNYIRKVEIFQLVLWGAAPVLDPGILAHSVDSDKQSPEVGTLWVQWIPCNARDVYPAV